MLTKSNYDLDEQGQAEISRNSALPSLREHVSCNIILVDETNRYVIHGQALKK
jgi:hypothetical protein